MTNREHQLELFAKDEGAARVRKHIEKAIAKERGADTPAGVELMKRAMEPLIEAIAHTIEEAQAGKPGPRMVATVWMKQLPAEVLAYLTVKAGISAAISSASLTHAAVDVGSMVEDELRLTTFEGTEPGLYATIMRQLKQRGATAVHANRVFLFAGNKAGVELPSISRTSKVLLGVKMLELLIETTGIIELVYVRQGRKTVARLRPTEKVNDWIKHTNMMAELMQPLFLPTVVPPRDWAGVAGGGYLTDALRKLPLVKRASKRQRDALEAALPDTVLRSINAIQRTGWRVNGRIYELMQHAWERGLQIAMPAHDNVAVPPKPLGFAEGVPGKAAWEKVDPAARKHWISEARRIHELNAETMGKRVGLKQMLEAARVVKDEPVIYFPHQLDFRGRAYAVPVGLQPQGNDQARALLTFAEGKPLNTPRAIGWLMIHGANLYGYDKAVFADRIAWVEERADLILRTAVDPFGELWWTEADKPWCFLAWCIEYARYLHEGDGFLSSLPIAVDGSCNGLQHFSAMLRDPVGGAAVNLVPSDLPSDIYQRVADRVIERLRELASVTERDYTQERFEQSLFAAGWLAFGIDRKITKRPVMVLPYGGTFRSCMQYVRESIAEKIAGGKENPFGDQLGKATGFLAKLVWESIGDVVVAARTAMTWLQQCARVAAKHKLPLQWTTPSGFVAYQEYKDLRSRRVQTKMQGSIVRLSLQEDGTKIDADRQALGISPNLVHSMDASAMMLTIDMALLNGVSQFAMIHDSYGTVAADMDTLSTCLREAFIDMYEENNVLEQFLLALPEEVRAACPPIPPMGSLALDGIRQSEFFFA